MGDNYKFYMVCENRGIKEDRGERCYAEYMPKYCLRDDCNYYENEDLDEYMKKYATTHQHVSGSKLEPSINLDEIRKNESEILIIGNFINFEPRQM